MGCWNGTCIASQLPIIHGDDVVLFFITKKTPYSELDNESTGFCSVNELWTPRCLPIYGKYNDYGSIEDIQYDWNTDFILENFKKDVIEVVGEKHEKSIIRDELTIESLLELMHRNRVFVNYGGNKLKIGYVMMHAKIYEELSTRTVAWYTGDMSHEILLDHAIKYYTALQKNFKEIENQKWGLIEFDFQELVFNHRNEFAPILRIDGYGVDIGIKTYERLLRDFVKIGLSVDSIRVSTLLNSLVKYLMFSNNFYLLRKIWVPQSGAGSQNCDYELHKFFHDLTDTIINDKLEWEKSFDD